MSNYVKMFDPINILQEFALHSLPVSFVQCHKNWPLVWNIPLYPVASRRIATLQMC